AAKPLSFGFFSFSLDILIYYFLDTFYRLFFAIFNNVISKLN
ncbi:unnamed protein product, partial [marine sediment metagenome]